MFLHTMNLELDIHKERKAPPSMDKGIQMIARIIRNKYTKEASLEINAEGNWSLYAGHTEESINRNTPILTGNRSGIYHLTVSTSIRIYFELAINDERIILAEKHLPMAGGYNFRDLGGIKTKEGRTVKWGKLFRADELSNLTIEDIKYLSSIPITSVIDFRAQNETKRSPDKLPATVHFTYPIAITPGNLSTEGIQANLLKTNIDTHMKHMNRLLVSDPACVRAFRIFFAIVQNNLSAPLIFHCSAGKDRAGMATALILFALGVDEETVMQDYLLSKIYLSDKYDAFIAKYPRAESIFTVKRMFLQAGINQIKRDHGSIMNYLTKVLKVDIARMRRLYLD
ncbi:protein-tyrosine phosphatase [Dysgonomonas sp. PFB1-18]|nr:protein-tyrosine phosphatase [Dysgonomonas sp. PF1-14]MDH6337050.1 protein-tyrosine phosphatase [Dysgonomonas sp. PF1-16]MDH6381036.1 protein-tyrosine phosphatase [Dysgonomonas sp. PFB1-18]MDH6396385.1 protein-tyrosine phosphatase [Dysgonomonas sp. PF1-23]